MAGKSNVPSGSVFRDVDGNGQPVGAISRGLDQAAFRARQEDVVILLARAEGATIDALSSWIEGGGASDVALAPISAALSSGN